MRARSGEERRASDFWWASWEPPFVDNTISCVNRLHRSLQNAFFAPGRLLRQKSPSPCPQGEGLRVRVLGMEKEVGFLLLQRSTKDKHPNPWPFSLGIGRREPRRSSFNAAQASTKSPTPCPQGEGFRDPGAICQPTLGVTSRLPFPRESGPGGMNDQLGCFRIRLLVATAHM